MVFCTAVSSQAKSGVASLHHRALAINAIFIAPPFGARHSPRGEIMRDLTEGSITGHIISMAAFIAVGMIAQTLYFLIDLYFVSGLGAAAIAGVSAAGMATFLIMAGTQVIGVGAMALAAQAAGRKDGADVDLIANQAMGLAVASAVAALGLGYALAPRLLALVAADAETTALGALYLYGFLPSLALMFPTIAIGASLRAIGVVQAPMIVQSGTIALNALLAPVLIAGWLTGVPLGVFGAGLASSIAVSIGLLALFLVHPRVQLTTHYTIAKLRPKWETWRRIAAIGLPSAAEFLIMFLYSALVYSLIRDFGAHAQAGFGVGMRVMQSIFLPAMAISFAAAPIAGQNFGARRYDRVRLAFRQSALIGAALMLVLTLLCQLRPDLLVAPFARDPDSHAVATDYLRMVSWNFIGVSLVFACAGMFQAMGDTRPSLLASGVRLIAFAIPSIALAQSGAAKLTDFWLISIAATWAQALLCLVLLGAMFKRKLGPAAAAS